MAPTDTNIAKLIYIACPITKGDIFHNCTQADDAMLRLMKAGFGVVNPALTCWAGAAKKQGSGDTFIQPSASAHGDFKSLTHTEWVNNCLPIVARVDGVVRLPGESVGADREVAHAKASGVPVFDSIESLIKYAELMWYNQ